VTDCKDRGDARRVGRSTNLALSHVLASCALPLAFPVVRIGSEHFGDGSMHQLAPISPALHLGARRVLAIGVGSASPGERSVHDAAVWPSLAQIAGHMLDAIFIDTLDMDLERLLRVNQTLACIPDSAGLQHRPALQRIEALVIRPSERIDSIAAAYAHELPLVMRFAMQRLGVLEPNGARVLSYLLFEQAYCRHLMRLGFSDGTAHREQILRFLGYGRPADAARAKAGDGSQRKAS